MQGLHHEFEEYLALEIKCIQWYYTVGLNVRVNQQAHNTICESVALLGIQCLFNEFNNQTIYFL